MEKPLGTNSHFAPLGNQLYGGGLNMKGEIFCQQTRVIIFGSSGRQISGLRVIFGLIRIAVNLEEICFNICQNALQNTGIKNVIGRGTVPNN